MNENDQNTTVKESEDMKDADGASPSKHRPDNHDDQDGDHRPVASSSVALSPPNEGPVVPTSNIPQIWNHFLEKINRIDQLEKRIDEHVKRSRRRIQNVLDSIPSFRRSHVRMFVTHAFDKYSGIWTLVIEGKLLIGNLDHDSANNVDTEGIMSVRGTSTKNVHVVVDNSKDGTKPQEEQQTQREVRQPSEDTKNQEPNSNAGGNPTTPTPADRKQEYRVGGEEEDPIQPIVFTHLFDKVEVTFRTIYQPRVAASVSSSTVPSGGISPVKKSRSAKRKAGGLQQQQQQEGPPEVDPRDLQSSAPTVLVWNKYRNALAASVSSPTTPDAHAFYVKYNNHFSERPPPPNMKFHSIVADIKLYPSRPVVPTNEQDPRAAPLYQIASTEMVDRLFGGKYGVSDDTRDGNERLHQETEGQPETKKIKLDPATTATTPTTLNDTIPLHNDIQIPQLLSYNEIIMTIFQYIQDNGLHDPMDKSLIICDKVLSDIFDVESMSFGQIWQLMLEKKMIKLVGSPKAPAEEGSGHEKEPPKPALPVTLTYVMNEQTTSSQLPSGFQEVEETSQQDLDKMSSLVQARRAQMMMSNPLDDPSHTPSLMSFDMDVAIPSLFNYRAREILRNVKKREFEYTTCRTKARYLLVASKGNEDTIKNKIEQAISGQGLVADNIPVFLALARAAHPNSETRGNSQIDARTCDLIGRLEEIARQTDVSWNAVEAMQNILLGSTCTKIQ